MLRLLLSFWALLVLSTQAFGLTNTLRGAVPQQHIALAPIAVATSATSTQVAAANPARTGLICTNTGTTTDYLAFGVAAVASSGVAIPAGTMWAMGDYSFTTQQVNAISTAAGSLACNEFQ